MTLQADVLEDQPAAPAAHTPHAGQQNAAQVVIRGVELAWNTLFDPKLHDREHLDGLHARLKAAQPFPHLVVEGWFNPVLLALVREEFETVPLASWSTQFNAYARVERSHDSTLMGPASQLYFSLLHSSFFLGVLAHVSGVAELITDPHLKGGGLHQTMAGGSFGIHTDFKRHPCTALDNRMVFITYLNDAWQPEWNGALELWDSARKQCVAHIEPEFGRSVLMMQGPVHFHGHPSPSKTPPGVTRKSVAAYFYTNPDSKRMSPEERSEGLVSRYMFASQADRLKLLLRQLLPPLVHTAIKRIARR